jgi:SAM-dependent methyltransferase
VPDEISLDESYDDFPRVEGAFQERLDGSLDPRGPDSLWSEFARVEPTRDELVADIGCGEGDDAIAVAQRFGVNVHGIDPVRRHVELGTAAAREAGLDDRVTFCQGTAEATGIAAASVDIVWSKEALMYADLDLAFQEFRRVLRPGGRVFVFQVFTGPRMPDDEAVRFWSDGAEAGNVRPEHLAAAADRAGFALMFRTDFAGEWGEFGQERSGAGGRRLLHAARLLRDPARYIEEFGEANYTIMLGDCMWHVYRMIGKLHGAAFGFRST